MTIGTPRHFAWLKGIVGTVFVLNVLDGILTIYWISARLATEANPMMADLIQAHPLLFMAVKTTLVALGTILLWRLRRRAFAVVAIFGVFLVYYYLFLYHLQGFNLQLIQRLGLSSGA